MFYCCSFCTILYDALPFSASWKTHTQHSSIRRQDEQQQKSVEFAVPVHQVFLVLIASSLDHLHKRNYIVLNRDLAEVILFLLDPPVSKMVVKALTKRKLKMWRWFNLHASQFFIVFPTRRMGHTKLPSIPFRRRGHLISRIYFSRYIRSSSLLLWVLSTNSASGPVIELLSPCRLGQSSGTTSSSEPVNK
jgi:hypothetical protein